MSESDTQSNHGTSDMATSSDRDSIPNNTSSPQDVQLETPPSHDFFDSYTQEVSDEEPDFVQTPTDNQHSSILDQQEKEAEEETELDTEPSLSSKSPNLSQSQMNIYRPHQLTKTNTRPLSISSSSSSVLKPHSRNPSLTVNNNFTTNASVSPPEREDGHSRATSLSDQITQSLDELTKEMSNNAQLEPQLEEADEIPFDNNNDNDDNDKHEEAMSAMERIKSKQNIIKQMASESNSKLSRIITESPVNDASNVVDTTDQANSEEDIMTPYSNPLTPMDNRELITPSTITSVEIPTTNESSVSVNNGANTPRNYPISSSNSRSQTPTNNTQSDDEDAKNYRNSIWLQYDKYIDNGDLDTSNNDLLKSGITDDEFLSDSNSNFYDSKNNSPIKLAHEKDTQSDDSEDEFNYNSQRSKFVNANSEGLVSNTTMNVIEGQNQNDSTSDEEDFSRDYNDSNDLSDSNLYTRNELEPIESSGSLSTGRYSRKSSFLNTNNNSLTNNIHHPKGSGRVSSDDEDLDQSNENNDSESDDEFNEDYDYFNNRNTNNSGSLEGDRRELFIRKNTMNTIRSGAVGPTTEQQFPMNTPPIRKYSSLLSNFDASPTPGSPINNNANISTTSTGELSQAAKDRSAASIIDSSMNGFTSRGLNDRNFSTSSTISNSSTADNTLNSNINTTSTSSTIVPNRFKPGSDFPSKDTIKFVNSDILPGCNIISITSSKKTSEERQKDLISFRNALNEFDTGLNDWLNEFMSAPGSQNDDHKDSNDLFGSDIIPGPNVKNAYLNISSSNQLHHHPHVVNSSQEIANEIAHDLKRTTSKVRGYLRKITSSNKR